MNTNRQTTAVTGNNKESMTCSPRSGSGPGSVNGTKIDRYQVYYTVTLLFWFVSKGACASVFLAWVYD
jgi:hypothetical protein